MLFALVLAKHFDYVFYEKERRISTERAQIMNYIL